MEWTVEQVCAAERSFVPIVRPLAPTAHGTPRRAVWTGHTCRDCLSLIYRVETQGEHALAAGYACDDAGNRICYQCCAMDDRRYANEHGRITLYLTRDDNGNHVVSNWPGTLTIRNVAIKCSWHNFAGKDGRTDAWFRWQGADWHGVNIGDSQLLRCKRLKAKPVKR